MPSPSAPPASAANAASGSAPIAASSSGRRGERDGGRAERLRERAQRPHATPSPSIKPADRRARVRVGRDRQEPPAEQHRDAHAQLEHLVELGRDQQHRRARAHLAAQLLAHRGGRGQVEPARRIHRHEHAGPRAQRARHAQLLLVAARERARGILGLRLDLEALDRRARRVVQRARGARVRAREHRRPAAARGLGQHQVLLDGQVEHEPGAMAIAGEQRERRPQHAQLPGVERAHAREQLLERTLAVAVDARQRDQLARAQLEVDAREPGRAYAVERERERSRLDRPAAAPAAAARRPPSGGRAGSRRVRASDWLATVSPARSTVTRSQTAVISSSLCEIRTMLLPSSRRRASSASSSSTSDGASTAVGSSSTSTFAPRASARAISSRCICATASVSVRASGSSAQVEALEQRARLARSRRAAAARPSRARRAAGSPPPTARARA